MTQKNKALEESMKELQAEAQSVLLNSGYHRSLERFHGKSADELDAKIDAIAKRIRNLEAQRAGTKGTEIPKVEEVAHVEPTEVSQAS